ncbi:MAG TPA: hypothetical protein VGJ73_23720 [Verrucomicrobiae bacterium]
MAIARLPKALQCAGFEVGVLCPEMSFIGSTRYLDRLFTYDPRCGETGVIKLFLESLAVWDAQLIVPGDERTLFFFHKMIQADREGALLDGALEDLIFSFGNLDWHVEAVSKRLTLQTAARLGIRTPRFARPISLPHALSCAKKFGWPVVLKKSSSFAGHGVWFCENEGELTLTYHEIDDPGHWDLIPMLHPFRTGGSPGRPCLSDDSFTVNEAISGIPAAVAVVAAHGKILGGVAALKVKCHPDAKSPSSVLRFINNEYMFEAAQKLVSHWSATGFIGFDFMIDDHGVVYLLECNPRPTPLSYMGEHSGCDLCLCLRQYLTGGNIPVPSAPSHEFVAHFPNEWQRDNESQYLHEAYHDVPWDDPALFYKLVADSQKAQSHSRSFKAVRRYLSGLRDTYITGRALLR